MKIDTGGEHQRSSPTNSSPQAFPKEDLQGMAAVGWKRDLNPTENLMTQMMRAIDFLIDAADRYFEYRTFDDKAAILAPVCRAAEVSEAKALLQFKSMILRLVNERRLHPWDVDTIFEPAFDEARVEMAAGTQEAIEADRVIGHLLDAIEAELPPVDADTGKVLWRDADDE